MNFGSLASGGPKETLSPAVGSTGDSVTFDGLNFGNTPVFNPVNLATSTESSLRAAYDDQALGDLLNPDNLGFGIKNGQASNINPNEGWFASTSDSSGNLVRMLGMGFDVQGVGNVPRVEVDWALFDRDPSAPGDITKSTPVGSGTSTLTVPPGNNTTHFSIPAPTGSNGFDFAYVDFTFPGTGQPNSPAVRTINFTTSLAGSLPSQQLPFGVTVTDGDGDTAKSTFNVTLHS